MKFVHTFLTKPMLDTRWYVKNQLESNIWYSALSVYFIKKLNQQINLYTDNYGKNLLDWLPYDNIILLPNLDHIHTMYWAYGKLIAQQQMNLGDIHIDNDVMLKKEHVLLILNATHNFDLVCQNYEPLSMNDMHGYSHNITKLNGILDIPFYGNAINCGLISFNNQEFKDKYINRYLTNVDISLQNKEFVNLLDTDKNSCPDLILEQLELYNVLYENNYTAYELLKYNDAKRIGYQHFIGMQKYQFVDTVKNWFYVNKPDWYHKINEMIDGQNSSM